MNESASPRKDAVASLARQLQHASPGVLARLRRADAANGFMTALFEIEWMLQAADVEPQSQDQHRRWALALHCLAIAHGKHAREQEAGAVLHRLYAGKEARLRQLIEADFDVLSDLMPRLARRLAAANAALDWWPLVNLLLYTGTDQEARANSARQRLVQQFLRTQGASKADAPQPA